MTEDVLTMDDLVVPFSHTARLKTVPKSTRARIGRSQDTRRSNSAQDKRDRIELFCVDMNCINKANYYNCTDVITTTCQSYRELAFRHVVPSRRNQPRLWASLKAPPIRRLGDRHPHRSWKKVASFWCDCTRWPKFSDSDVPSLSSKVARAHTTLCHTHPKH